MVKVLFILKKRISYGVSYGLRNSCEFIVNFLKYRGIEAKLVEVVDANCIDREVHCYKPTHVIIEALWVPPSKFPILFKLHKKVNWFVRLHSNLPFLANEGIAIDYLKKYDELPNLRISTNSEKFQSEIRGLINLNTVYLPNIYFPSHPPYKRDNPYKTILDVGCFGAVRPLKNTLIQAAAAISYANDLNKKLRFHINARAEQQGNQVLKNLEAAFKDTKHELVIHNWLDHKGFLKLIAKMDACMQISLSETFNIVTADSVYSDVPTIGSPEISWLHDNYQANPTDFRDIKKKLEFAILGDYFNLQSLNVRGLKKWNREAGREWINFVTARPWIKR